MINFSNKGMSNPDVFNYNLESLKDSINNSLFGGLDLEGKIKRYISIYNEDYIEKLSYNISILRDKIESFELLSRNNNMNNVKRYGFVSPADIDVDTKYYVNNHNPLLFYSNSLMNLNKGSLTLPVAKKEEVGSKSISLHSDSAYGSTTDGSKYMVYIVKNDSNGIEFNVNIDFNNLTSISSVSFENIAELSYDLLSFEYYNKKWIKLENIKEYSLFSNVNIEFPLIEAEKIRMGFGLEVCRATNLLINGSNEELASLLTRDYGELLNLDVYHDDNRNNYHSFIFNFGFSNLSIYKKKYSNHGMWCSSPVEARTPSHIHIEVDDKVKDASIEYNIIIENYSDSGIVSSLSVPILPTGRNRIVKERLFPILPGTLGLPSTITIDDAEYSISAAAKLSFFPDKNKGLSFYTNDMPLNLNINTSIKFKDNYIYFLKDETPAFNEDNIYTISYTPDRGSRFMTPIDEPNKSITSIIDYKYSSKDEINMSHTPSGYIEDENGEYTFVRILLPNSNDITIESIDRYYKEKKDAAMPIIKEDSYFIIGKALYLKHDTKLYPKLSNCTYKIKCTYPDNSGIYYYLPDNSIGLKWENWKESYSYSMIRVSATAHNTSNKEPFVLIKNVDLYHKTENPSYEDNK